MRKHLILALAPQIVMSGPVLGTRLGFSTRAASILTAEPSFTLFLFYALYVWNMCMHATTHMQRPRVSCLFYVGPRD